LKKLVEVVKGRDSKVVVFSQFLSALELAQRALKTSGLACVAPALLPVEVRPAAVSAFVNEPAVGVCLLTLDHAQSAGLTLTVASTVVLLDPVLDTSIEDQAIARVHRIGQSVPVTAIRLCQGDTIDETIVALQAARRGAKRQKGALSATGQVRVAELVKLFSVEEEQV
jgi:SNF2 family DNA or RNA helicase